METKVVCMGIHHESSAGAGLLGTRTFGPIMTALLNFLANSQLPSGLLYRAGCAETFHPSQKLNSGPLHSASSH